MEKLGQLARDRELDLIGSTPSRAAPRWTPGRAAAAVHVLDAGSSGCCPHRPRAGGLGIRKLVLGPDSACSPRPCRRSSRAAAAGRVRVRAGVRQHVRRFPGAGRRDVHDAALAGHRVLVWRRRSRTRCVRLRTSWTGWRRTECRWPVSWVNRPTRCWHPIPQSRAVATADELDKTGTPAGRRDPAAARGPGGGGDQGEAAVGALHQGTPAVAVVGVPALPPRHDLDGLREISLRLAGASCTAANSADRVVGRDSAMSVW